MLQTTNPLRACMVTGSPEAGRCGIHDYTLRLTDALQQDGVDAEILDHRDWSLPGTLRLAARLRELKPDILHMQYPMIVGWRSLGPHATGFLSRFPQVLTLHEFSSFDALRRASLRAFAMSAAKVVLTTDFEKARFLQQFPRAAGKVAVVPIGSNVPFLPSVPAAPSERTIICFGQIKPMKGLEPFIELVELATALGKPWRFQVLGAPVTWAGDYLKDMQRRVAGANVEWLLDRGDEEAAGFLSRASAAYLAYPDGVSERRGSLIASLGNGVPVVTTHGAFEPADIGEAVMFAADAREAAARLEALFAQPALERHFREAGPAYVGRFAWPRIARAYHDLYRQVVGAGALAGAAS